MLAAAAAILLSTFSTAPASALPQFDTESAQPSNGPALWVITDQDTTIYLFGTFHALDADLGWFSSMVRGAFDQSDELVLETIVPTDPRELHAALMRHQLAQGGKPIAGQPVVAPRRAQNFVASTGRTVASAQAAGISVMQGADAVLKRAATDHGKTISGLESFDFQLGMLSGLPASVTSNLATGDPLAQIRAMRLAWRRGDSSKVTRLVGTMEQQAPLAYQRIFAERNQRWAAWLAERMERPGTIFVAVGSGHLVGDDSVQAQLDALGYRATRID